MKEYRIPRLSAPFPQPEGKLFDPAVEPFCAGEYAAIDQYVWPGDYRPEAMAWAAWDEAGLYVLLSACEQTISAPRRLFGGDVFLDSCLECFIKPFEDDARYMNIEMNAAGSALVGIGPSREDRITLSTCPEGLKITASEHAGGWWAAACRLPFSVIEALYGRSAKAIRYMEGNFFSCDETIHPHFGSWNPIVAPEPDFHRPECFGRLILAE